MVVASSPVSNLDIVIGYGARIAMLATAIVLIIASFAESYISSRVTLVFSRITAIIAELFLIVFTLQIANDCQRIFFSNIQALAQIIDFFTFITSNNAITER